MISNLAGMIRSKNKNYCVILFLIPLFVFSHLIFFTTSQLHNFTTSQLHNFTTSQLHNFTTSQLHNFTTSQLHTIVYHYEMLHLIFLFRIYNPILNKFFYLLSLCLIIE
ncbi:hypothetical protein E0H80_09245 [Acinetobacter sp. ANC 4779]|nr:hypothetical protein E0H80_09245 [Acinetobacter sp. ANC 4779]